MSKTRKSGGSGKKAKTGGSGGAVAGGAQKKVWKVKVKEGNPVLDAIHKVEGEADAAREMQRDLAVEMAKVAAQGTRWVDIVEGALNKFECKDEKDCKCDIPNGDCGCGRWSEYEAGRKVCGYNDGKSCDKLCAEKFGRILQNRASDRGLGDHAGDAKLDDAKGPEGPTPPGSSPGPGLDPDGPWNKVMELVDEAGCDPVDDTKFLDVVEKYDLGNLHVVDPKWSLFINEILLQFETMGYSEGSFKKVMGRVRMWLARYELDKEECWAEKSIKIVYAVYYKYEDFSSFWGRIRMRFTQWHRGLVDQLVEMGLLKAAILLVFALPLLPLIAVGWGLYKLMDWLLTKDKSRPVVRIVRTVEDYCTNAKLEEVKIEEYNPQTDKIEVVSLARYIPNSFSQCKVRLVPVGFSVSLENLWLPRLCAHNEGVALRERQLLPPLGTPDTRSKLWDSAATCFNSVLPGIQAPVASDHYMCEVFYARYPDKLRAQLFAADCASYENICIECVTKAFVKLEWNCGKAIINRAPRLISGKTDEYLSGTGPEYYWWQKAMIAQYWPDVKTALQQQFIYTGGMTGDMIGEIVHHFESLGWWAYEGDFSRYDGHTEYEAIMAEVNYYDKASAFGVRVSQLLRQQFQVRGRTTNGWKFSHRGKVCSGVINTSFGNSLRNGMIMSSYAEGMKLEKDWAMIVLGDDNIIFTKKRLNVDDLVAHCVMMGHKLEIVERSPTEYDFLEFCSQRLWATGYGRILGPKPGRVLAKAFMPHRILSTDKEISEHMVGVAKGFKHYNWVPGVGDFSQKVLRDNPTLQGKYVNDNPYKILLKEACVVDPEAVEQMFFRVYGFDVSLLRDDILALPKIVPGMDVSSSVFESICLTDGVIAKKGLGSEASVCY
jgi:hypothetical protein